MYFLSGLIVLVNISVCSKWQIRPRYFFLCAPNFAVCICSVLLLRVRTAPSQELMKVTEVCYSVVG